MHARNLQKAPGPRMTIIKDALDLIAKGMLGVSWPYIGDET